MRANHGFGHHSPLFKHNIQLTTYSYSIIVLVFITQLLSGCSTEQLLKPVQAGNKADLEKLATSYRKQADSIPFSPSRLTPKKRKQFIELVFTEAGFSYSETLKTMANGGYQSNTEYHDDLAELLLYPTSGGTVITAIQSFFSEEEFINIKSLKQQFIEKDLH